MSSVQLSGLNSGIDTQSIIAQLLAVEKKRLTMYQTKQTTLNDKSEALGEVKSRLNSYLGSVKDLSNADELKAFKVATSDEDIITATATSDARQGSHTIEVGQLACAERYVSNNGETNPEDVVGAGTFIYSYGGVERVVTISNANTTLEDLVTLINSDTNNPGVTASLLDYGDEYHLVLSGNDAGADNTISINSKNSEVWKSGSDLTNDGESAAETTRLMLLDGFTGSLSGDETITITGKNHTGGDISSTFNVTSNTTISTLLSEINKAFDGVAVATYEDGEIMLTDSTSGVSGMQISLAYNDTNASSTFALPTMAQSAIGGTINANLDGYDTQASEWTCTQQAANSKIKVDGYPVDTVDGEGHVVENWIERDTNAISDVLDGVTLNLNDVTDPTGTGERITLTRDTEGLETKIGEFVSAYNELVSTLKEYTNYNTDTSTAGVLLSDVTVSNILQQLRSPLIAKASGFSDENDEYLSPVNIGLTVDKNGTLSLDSDKLSDSVSKDYNAVLELFGAMATGSSSSSTIGFASASSDYTTAGQYDVEVVIAGGIISSAKIKLATESTWRDMTIVDGNTLIGNSLFDNNGDPIYAENGLQLSVDLDTNGTFTSSIYVKKGFAGEIESRLDRMLDSTSGSLIIDMEHVDDQIDEIKDRISDEEDRLSKFQEYLTAKYARLEKTLTLLQQQFSSITGSSS